jgi:UDP-N-acetylmuramate dehydrogenase
MQIHRHQNLLNYNTFRVTAQADYLVEIASANQLQELFSDKFLSDLPRFILGGGSNILFTGDISGLIIKVNIPGIEIIDEDHNFIWIKAGAGQNWHDLVSYCVDNGWYGIENLALIPGSCGAAPIQNIGAYGVELNNVLDSLEAFEIETGKIRTFCNQDCLFNYRYSIFKDHLKGKYIISSITLKLSKRPEFTLTYLSLNDYLKKSETEVTLRSIYDAVISIRRSKLPDPKELGNCGSFFKNPEIGEERYLTLKSSFPDLKAHPSGPGAFKLSAAWLIEQCGWKGKRIGSAGVYGQQALVLVNYGSSSGEEIANLAAEIQDSVAEKFNVSLVPEVTII